MAYTVASSSTPASPIGPYHVFISHRGADVKKTFASHLYYRLLSAHIGLRVFLDRPELRAGDNFPCQIKDAIKNASVNVAIFSPGYAESEWCLDELLYMLESKADIIPVFYHVEPAVVRWPQGKGIYAEALRSLENKQTHEEKLRHNPVKIQKWRKALSSVAEISGLDLEAPPYNGDEGALVEKIVALVLEKVKSILLVGISEFYCSPQYGAGGGHERVGDGTYSGIRGIFMTTKDNFLTSVQLDYGLDGDESVKDKHILGFRRGSANGTQINYNLNYPEEIVTKVSGHVGRGFGISWHVITSLTFHTNQRKLPSYGQAEGTPFETEEGGKIVGVFGASGTLLDSIGVYMLKPRTSKHEEFYRSQLYGGPGGDYWNDGTYSGIRRITMTAKDNSLTSVQLQYGLEGDESVKDTCIWGVRHGSADGVPIEYNLNYPEEIVTKVSGYIGSYKSWPAVIKSLTFHTNQRKLGPWGQEQGSHFETEMGGNIVGLFGSSATVVDSIGVYMLKPRPLKNEEFYCSPLYGDTGGHNQHSDGTYSGIRSITMTEKDNLLTSVRLHYGLEGDESLKDRSFEGFLRGSAMGSINEYKLHYPQEFVTKISGYFGKYKSFWPRVIKSLTFHTNQRKLGPCGQEQGTPFETEERGRIVGICGSSGIVVESIGVYMLKAGNFEKLSA